MSLYAIDTSNINTFAQEELADLLWQIGCGLFFVWSGWKAAHAFSSLAPTTALRLDARNPKQRRYLPSAAIGVVVDGLVPEVMILTARTCVVRVRVRVRSWVDLLWKLVFKPLRRRVTLFLPAYMLTVSLVHLVVSSLSPSPGAEGTVPPPASS